MASHDLNRASSLALGEESEGATAPEAVKLIALSRTWYSAAATAYAARNYDKAHQLGLASDELSDAASEIGEPAAPVASLKGLATSPRRMRATAPTKAASTVRAN